MATKIWRGTAKNTAQVDTVYPSNVNPGDTYSVTINQKTLEVTASKLLTDQADLVADVVGKLVTAIGQYNNDEPEWAEVSAAAGTNRTGDTDHVVITGPTDGKPFTLTASATQLTLDVEIEEGVRGVAAVAAQSFTNSRGPSVEMKSGRDGSLGNTKVSVSRSTSSDDTQWRITFNFVPENKSFTSRWLSSSASTEEVAYALAAIGFTCDVSLNEDQDYELVLVDSVLAARSTNLNVEIESRDSTYSVSVEELTQQNEIQYFRLSASSGDFTVDGQTVSAASAASTLFDWGNSSEAPGSIAEALVAAGTISDGVDIEWSYIGKGASGYNDFDSEFKYGWWKLEFKGSKASENMSLVTVADSTLSGAITETIVTAEAVEGVNEQQRVGFNRDPTGGTFTLTYDGSTTGAIAYNASAATVQTALEGTTGISSGDVSVTGPDGGPWLVEFTGSLAATDVDMMTGSGASLTGGLTPANTASTSTSPEGPNWWSVAENWYNPASPTSPTAPAAGDDIVFRNNEVSCLYGLDGNSGDTLTSLTIESTFTGLLGLPRFTGEYYEYRVRRLEVGATTVEIGKGRGTGSDRIYLDLEAVTSTVDVIATGTSLDDEPPVQITGSDASNVFRVKSGSVGFGVGEPSDSPAATTMTIGGTGETQVEADVIVAAGTITTIEQIGGISELRCSATTFNLRAGDSTIDGSGTFGTVNCAGELQYLGTGTTTTMNVSAGGELSLANASQGATFTNLSLYAGATLDDPWLKGTYSNGIDLAQCAVSDVTLNLGINITLTRTAI